MIYMTTTITRREVLRQGTMVAVGGALAFFGLQRGAGASTSSEMRTAAEELVVKLANMKSESAQDFVSKRRVATLMIDSFALKLKLGDFRSESLKGDVSLEDKKAAVDILYKIAAEKYKGELNKWAKDDKHPGIEVLVNAHNGIF